MIAVGTQLPVTVSAMAVVAVSVPDFPVTVIVEVPAAAVALAVSVSTLVPVVGLAPNTALTPLGRPDATRVTLPVNPPVSFTLMVSVSLVLGVTESADSEDPRVKPCGTKSMV